MDPVRHTRRRVADLEDILTDPVGQVRLAGYSSLDIGTALLLLGSAELRRAGMSGAAIADVLQTIADTVIERVPGG